MGTVDGGRGLAGECRRLVSSAHPGQSRGPTAAGLRGRRLPNRRCHAGFAAARRRAEQVKGIAGFARDLQDQGPDFAWNRPCVDLRLTVFVTPEAPGLVLPSESGRSTGARDLPGSEPPRGLRNGLKGLPTVARRHIGQSIACLDSYVRRPLMWTASLPDEDYDDLRISGRWQDFQRSIADGLTRYLKAHGLPPLVIAVAEIGNDRSKRTGRPMPHIHLVSTGWGVRDATGQWLLRPEVMDGLVAAACSAAGLPSRHRPACSRVEPVERSVKAYLAGYLKKGSDLSSVDLSDGWEALVPHQWWNRSQALKALADGHTFRLPVGFAAFVESQRQRLEGLRLGMGRLVVVGRRKTRLVDRTIDVLAFQFLSPEALLQALEWWSLWIKSPSLFEAEADRCTE